jgi:hypothetical protein
MNLFKPMLDIIYVVGFNGKSSCFGLKSSAFFLDPSVF